MKKIITYKSLSIGIILLSILAIAFFGLSTTNTTLDTSNQQLVSLNDGWYYYDYTGNKIEITLPCKIKAENTLELFYDSYNNQNDYPIISTHAAVYDVEIFADQKLIYQFQDNGREINTAVRGNIVCYGTIPDTTSTNLRLIYHSTSGIYKLNTITVSTANALIKSVLIKSLFCLIVSIAMLVLGLLAVAFEIVLEIQKERDKRILFIAFFLIVCGLWCLSDSAFVQLLVNYNNLIFTLDFYLFMIMPIPLAYFILTTDNMSKYKLLKTVPIIYYLNIIAQSILAALGIFTFFRMLYVTHLLMMFAGVFCSLFILFKEYLTTKKNELIITICVLTSVGVLGLVAITLYILVGYSTYQIVYQTGLLLLMSILLSTLLKEFMQSVQYRTEAIVYKQLSEQDKMTKLDNRRSFDALLEKMETGTISYENAALIFMDVNYLKKANDTYGHEVGDELIINAALCIKNAFGNSGYCYRIGGDEFCVVILDPSCTSEEFLNRIHTEIELLNQNDSLTIPLSLACGCSFIKENNSTKTLPEWKSDADNRMYKDKKRIKAQRKI